MAERLMGMPGGLESMIFKKMMFLGMPLFYQTADPEGGPNGGKDARTFERHPAKPPPTFLFLR